MTYILVQLVLRNYTTLRPAARVICAALFVTWTLQITAALVGLPSHVASSSFRTRLYLLHSRLKMFSQKRGKGIDFSIKCTVLRMYSLANNFAAKLDDITAILRQLKDDLETPKLSTERTLPDTSLYNATLIG